MPVLHILAYSAEAASAAKAGSIPVGCLVMMLLAGCAAPGKLGPDLGPLTPAPGGSRLDALFESVRARKERVKWLYSLGGGMRYTGPLKAGGKVRSIPLRADMYFGEGDCFRLEVKHPLTGTDLATVVVSEGEFLVEDLRGKKGYEGDVMKVIRGRAPELAVRAEDVRAWQLFLPSLGARSGEGAALAGSRGQYVVEFWKPGHAPARRVWLSAWSHTPLRMAFYEKDGGVGAEVAWSRFAEVQASPAEPRDEEKLVLPQTVTIRSPRFGRTVRFSLSKPKLNKRISDEAFELLPSPGIEVEEVKPEPEKKKPGDRGEPDS